MRSVFYINEVVTVNKSEDISWDELIPPVADTLEENLISTLEGHEIPTEASTVVTQISENFIALEKPEKIQLIDSILDETIRPGLAGDGGRRFASF